MSTNIETDMRRAHRKIQSSMEGMTAAKADLLALINRARDDEGYTLTDIAKVLGITKSKAQKYAEQARERMAS